METESPQLEPPKAPPPSPAEAPAPRPKLLARLKSLLEEYGSLALYIYFALYALVFVGFAIAFAAGLRVKSASGSAGLLGAAWVAAKLTQPLRILATLALVPIVARVTRRKRAAEAPVAVDAPVAADATSPPGSSNRSPPPDG